MLTIAAVTVGVGTQSSLGQDWPVPPGGSAAQQPQFAAGSGASGLPGTAVSGARAGATGQASAARAVPSQTAAPQATPSATPQVTPSAVLLEEPGPVPEKGSGRFEYAPGTGQVFGRTGPLRRYRVAVEQGAEEDPATFAATVDRVLGDPRSWPAGGRLRLQRVPGTAAHDFTVHLATPDTAARMCAAAGVDIRVNGRPYTSCRTTSKVIINLERWRRSVPHVVEAQVPLETYRAYVINHEVGHELGYGHERCPGPRRPAPVMMQQTLFLNGCVVNPWPYLDGRRYAGPRV